jgi:hypothetical protein
MCFELAILLTEAVWNQNQEAAAAGSVAAIFHVSLRAGPVASSAAERT